MDNEEKRRELISEINLELERTINFGRFLKILARPAKARSAAYPPCPGYSGVGVFIISRGAFKKRETGMQRPRQSLMILPWFGGQETASSRLVLNIAQECRGSMPGRWAAGNVPAP